MIDSTAFPRLLVVDVEGNGASPPDLIEIATVSVDTGRAAPEMGRSWLIKPPVPISPVVTRIHHITNRDVADAPPITDIADDVRAHLGTAWIAAHNAKVDYRVLSRHLPGWQPAGVIDTLRLARNTYPTAPGYSLDALITHTGLDLTQITGRRHRAGYDAHATALLLLDLATHYASWDALIATAVPPGLPGSPPEPEELSLW